VPGSGLAYGGISNAFAVEFDTWTDTDKNDPGTKIERHISAIIKPGSADGNEARSIAYNDNPLNFKSSKFEGFIRNPTIKIEYLHGQLRVLINNIHQLGFYHNLDIPARLGLPKG
jgi:hypothetical protein